jgi:Flp pilus assembly protein TadD
MSGYLLRITLLMTLLGVGCSSVQYADVQKFVHDGQYEQAETNLMTAGPVDAEGWALLAQCRYFLKDYRGQSEASKRSLELSSSYRYLVVHYLQLAYIEQLETAVTALEAGNDLEAVKGFNEVLVFGKTIDETMDPLIVKTNQRVSAFAGAVALRLQDHIKAKPFLASLRTEWQDSPELMERLAHICLQAGDASSCTEVCESILALHPENSDMLQLRALAAGQSGRQDAALNAYRDAIEATPDNKTLHRDLGSILYRMQEWGSAREHLEFACHSGDPDSLNLMLMLAECAYHQGSYVEALDFYGRVSRSRPADPDAVRGAGVCLHALGRKAEADSAFHRATRMSGSRANRRGSGSFFYGNDSTGVRGGSRQ